MRSVLIKRECGRAGRALKTVIKIRKITSLRGTLNPEIKMSGVKIREKAPEIYEKRVKIEEDIWLR